MSATPDHTHGASDDSGQASSDLSSPKLTRRDRVRQAAIEEIKGVARDQLAPHTPGELSLRAVAREVGLTPSAIYRYFGSRQELVTAVAADAYHSAAQNLLRAVRATEGASCLQQSIALGLAYRSWALANKAEFSLIFTTDQGALADSPGLMTADNLHEFYAAPLQVFHAGVVSGEIDSSKALFTRPPKLTETTEQLRGSTGNRLDSHQLGVMLTGWASLHGYVSLEIYGQLGWFVADLDDTYEAHVRATMRAMGFVDG